MGLAETNNHNNNNLQPTTPAMAANALQKTPSSQQQQHYQRQYSSVQGRAPRSANRFSLALKGISSRFQHNQPTGPEERIGSLQQLKQLYSSAPDFSDLVASGDGSQQLHSAPITSAEAMLRHRVAPPPPPPRQQGGTGLQRAQSTGQFHPRTRDDEQIYEPLGNAGGVSSSSHHNTSSSSTTTATNSLDTSRRSTDQVHPGSVHSDQVRSGSTTTIAVNHSPTDSGYRSNSRSHLLTQTLNVTIPPPPQLAVPPKPDSTITNANGAVPSGQQHMQNLQSNTSSASLAESVDLPVPTSASGMSSTAPSTSSAGDRCPPLQLLKKLPYNERDLVRLVQRGRCKPQVERIDVDVVPCVLHVTRLLLTRAVLLLRRLCATGRYTDHTHVQQTMQILLVEGALASVVDGAGIQAVSMFAMESLPVELYRHSREHRANLCCSVGAFHRWMNDLELSAYVSEPAVVYLIAVIESLIEHLLIKALQHTKIELDSSPEVLLSGQDLLQYMRECEPRLWALSRPHAHLIIQPKESYIPGEPSDVSLYKQATCVGSVSELSFMIRSIEDARPKQDKAAAVSWSSGALNTLYFYLQCTEKHSSNILPIRPTNQCEHPLTLYGYTALAMAFCRAGRRCLVMSDDVTQAAQLLAPTNAHTPPPAVQLLAQPSTMHSPEQQHVRAWQLLVDDQLPIEPLLPSLCSNLGARGVNSTDADGMSALCRVLQARQTHKLLPLIHAGADLDYVIPYNAQTASLGYAGLSPLSLSVLLDERDATDLLLRMGAQLNNPGVNALQLAAAAGDTALCVRLLECGADAFESTLSQQQQGYGHRQTGAPSALALAAAHNRCAIIHHMLRYTQTVGDQRKSSSMSLNDFLKEGARRTHEHNIYDRVHHEPSELMENEHFYAGLSKQQQRALQEALYYASEHGQLNAALLLARLGCAWTLYAWSCCLLAALSDRRRSVAHWLLDQCQQQPLCPQQLSRTFVDDVLPCLMQFFQTTRNERTRQKLARLFSSFVDDQPAPVAAASDSHTPGTGQFDAQLINNPELSDVEFVVEGRRFYAHRLVLANASRKLKELIVNAQAPIQVDYSTATFYRLMQFVYCGSQADVAGLGVDDLCQLLAGCQQFGLAGLFHRCQSAVSGSLNTNNVLHIYKMAVREDSLSLQRCAELYMLANLEALVTGEPAAAAGEPTQPTPFVRLLQSTGRLQLAQSLLNALTYSLNQQLSTN